MFKPTSLDASNYNKLKGLHLLEQELSSGQSYISCPQCSDGSSFFFFLGVNNVEA